MKILILILIIAATQCVVTRAQFEWGEREFDHRRRADQVNDDPDGDGIIGEAGKDYPVLRRPPPDGNFHCRDKIPGIYADMDTGCQVYHICQSDERMESSICVNGTLFNQEALACDWWYNVDCASSHRFYWLNSKIGKHSPHPPPPPPHRDFLLPPPPPPTSSFTVKFPPPKKHPTTPKKPSGHPSSSKRLKDKHRPPFHDVIHYGRDAFDPSLNVPPRPKNSDKFVKHTKQPLSSPMTLPVNSDDVIAGYSDLYLNKPVDED